MFRLVIGVGLHSCDKGASGGSGSLCLLALALLGYRQGMGHSMARVEAVCQRATFVMGSVDEQQQRFGDTPLQVLSSPAFCVLLSTSRFTGLRFTAFALVRDKQSLHLVSQSLFGL